MNTKTRTLTAIAVAAALGGTAIAGASYAGHRGGGHGMGFLDKGQLAVSAMEMFDAVDTRTATASSPRPRSTRRATTATRRTTPTATAISAWRSSPASGTRPPAR